MKSGKLRRLVRRSVAISLRQHYAEVRRRCSDLIRRTTFEKERGGEDWPVRIELEQPIRHGELFENKLSNLRLGSASIHRNVIGPGGHWSFWRQTGRPTTTNGYREGRTIVDGRLVRQVGGGLCQLSGLLYHLALVAGFETVERHPHSIDIYHDLDRAAPLGSDATVVWGYKDLRLTNSYAFPIAITCFVDSSRVIAQVRSRVALQTRDVAFVREAISSDRVLVRTIIDGVERDVTVYEYRPGLELEPTAPTFAQRLPV